MTNTIHCSLFKSIRFSNPFDPESIDNNDYNGANTFWIETTEVTSCLWMLMHFKYHEIEGTEMYYRKKSKKKLNPQKKSRKSFSNTTALLTYFSDKKYDLNFWKIRFKNGWEISHLYKTFNVTTNSKTERDEIMNRLISIAGINPIETNIVDQNKTYLIQTDGTLIPEDFPF
ncbi:MAG: hypothetical protein ACI86C_000247 [Candidatus Latescibacterota bacterium]|jgi:hypothetical protein